MRRVKILLLGDENSGKSSALQAYLNLRLEVTGSTLAHNKADGTGAAVYAQHTVVTMTNTKLDTNIAGAWGGGMRLNKNPKVYIDNCTFVNNRAVNAGGVLADRVADLDIASTVFTGNVATERGGGAIWQVAGVTTIHASSTFTRNMAAMYGPDIYCWDSGNITALLSSGMDIYNNGCTIYKS